MIPGCEYNKTDDAINTKYKEALITSDMNFYDGPTISHEFGAGPGHHRLSYTTRQFPMQSRREQITALCINIVYKHSTYHINSS
jgi:hypothetical protein